MTAELYCPRDGKRLTRETVSDHPLERCPACRGIFLGKGELNEVAAPIPGDIELSTVELDSFEHEDEYAPAVCPQCTPKMMKKVEFVGDRGLVLDYCDRCGGFWLDDKELDQINAEIRRLNEAAAQLHDPPWLFLVRLAASVTQ